MLRKALMPILFVALLLLVSACSSPVVSETASGPLGTSPPGGPAGTQAQSTEGAATPSGLPPSPAPPTATATALSMPPTPSAIPPVAPTPTPLPYPPAGLPAISPENAGQLRQVAWLAEDRLTGIAWSPSHTVAGAWLGVVSLNGVAVYETASLPPACYGENCDTPPAAGRFVPAPDLAASQVFLSPDGRSLGVLRPEEFAVDLYDVASGQVTRRLQWLEHAAPALYGVAFSPDWRTLAWYARGTLLLMDVESGQPGPMLGTEDFIQAIAFSPDSRLIAAAAAGTVDGEYQPLVQVWRVSNGEPLVTLTGYTQVSIGGVANLLRFSQDGRFLMAGHSDGSIAVWNIPGGEPGMFIGGSNIPVSELALSPDIALSPDGRILLAAYANQTATRWDLTKAQEPLTWSGQLAAISPDAGVVALLSPDGWLKAIDPATNQEMATLANNPYLDSLSFSPDGSYLAALSISASSVSLWQMPEAAELSPFYITPDRAAEVAYAPDGTIIAAAWHGCQARLWEPQSGQVLRMVGPAAPGCDSEPEAAFSPDGRWLALASGDSGSGEVSLWDPASGQAGQTFAVGEGSLQSLAFSPKGEWLAAGSGQTDDAGNVTGGQAVVWDLASGAPLHALPHANWVTSLAFAPDGRTLATGTAALDSNGAVAGSLVSLWDLKSGQLARSFESPGLHVISLAFSPDGAVLAAGDWSGTLVLWDAAGGEALASLGTHSAPVADLAFSPDGRLLAAAILTGGPSQVEIWDVASGELLARLEGERLAFSPDGTALATIVFGSLRLWGVVP